MKPNFIPIAAGLLLAATNSGWALPPRQESASGQVAVIDRANRTLTLKSKDGGAPLTFVWNDSTRFSYKGGCAKCSFYSGQTVHVWYRRELGQDMLREMSAKGAACGCGVVCQ